MQLDYADIFACIQPGFFDRHDIRALPPDAVYEEQALPLTDFDPAALAIPVPARITFGLYTDDHARLIEAVRAVDEEWAQYFQPGDRIFAAMDGERICSFCILDDFGEYKGMKIGAPGCVGTVPGYRRQGIGLRMVQLATQQLKEAGYELSWIHYTSVGHWYARLGYKTVIRWHSLGILEA